jgi:phosphoribosylformimino-5-aminoimidazole carboxamide ribotide isomerase
MFELIPAIDLKAGKCVRLREGAAASATEYGDDPVAMALRWQDQGATRLHVVDLDGAFAGDGKHTAVARSLFAALHIPVQFGGGLRTLEQIERILDMGADRAVVGTVALEHPEIVEEAVRRDGAAIVVGIDARGGRVAVRGWIEQSVLSALELARRMGEIGVERIIYTDIARDGMLTGVNVDETAALARQSGQKVIASGGVSGQDDVRRLWDARDAGIEGVILGRALYESKIDFVELRQRMGQW